VMRPAQASGRWPAGLVAIGPLVDRPTSMPRSEKDHLMPVKPTEQEDEYFARLEFERQREARAFSTVVLMPSRGHRPARQHPADLRLA
jgi:hypothetical protein